MKTIQKLLVAATITVLATSCGNNETKTTATDTQATANEKLEQVTPDYHNYAQYISCKIDGQPFLAYYEDGHTTGITNSLNLPSQVVFNGSADEAKINGKTKTSELNISFYTLPKKATGTLTSNTDFYVQGHTDMPEGGDLKYVSFVTKSGQSLIITSNKDGVLEGSFSMDVVDENNPSRTLKITDGNFKLKQGGKSSVQTDANGNVNMDSLTNSIK